MRSCTFSMLALAVALLTVPAAADPACGLYDYRADVVRVIDGDTIVADIDLGFNTWRRGEHLRLRGIDAPEVRGDERESGLVSADALRERLAGQRVILCTTKDERGSFGRYLVDIYLDDEHVNAWMVREGFAQPRD